MQKDGDLLDTYISDDDEEKVRDHPEFYADVEFAKPEFQLIKEQKFTYVYAFRQGLVEWYVRDSFELWYLKNEKSRVIAICKEYNLPNQKSEGRTCVW